MRAAILAAIAVALTGCITLYPNSRYDPALAGAVGAELRR